MADDDKSPQSRRTSPRFLEDQVSEAERRGDFKDLPGKGEPLKDLSRDPMWWVKDKLKREGASYLPPGLQLRRDKELALEKVREIRTEPLVRQHLEELNDHIRETNRSIFSGPPSNVSPVDIDAEVERWRRERDGRK